MVLSTAGLGRPDSGCEGTARGPSIQSREARLLRFSGPPKNVRLAAHAHVLANARLAFVGATDNDSDLFESR